MIFQPASSGFHGPGCCTAGFDLRESWDHLGTVMVTTRVGLSYPIFVSIPSKLIACAPSHYTDAITTTPQLPSEQIDASICNST